MKLETFKKLGKILTLNDRDSYAAAIFIALMFAIILLAAYYPVLKPPDQKFTTIKLYDEQKGTNYPELVIVNQNNTFTVHIEVENHMGISLQSEIQVKVTNQTIALLPLSLDAEKQYTKTLENGESWEIQPTITLNETGNHSVIFELWIYDDAIGAFRYSQNAAVLNIEVVDQA